MSLRRSFSKDGHLTVEPVLGEATLAAIDRCLRAVSRQRAGTRQLLAAPWCSALARRLRGHPTLLALLPRGAVAVQCTLFDKSPMCNWAVPMHRDLHIPVAQRVHHPRLRGWSRKEGSWFVEVPAVVLSRLVALRVQLDAGVALGGGLQVVSGSHRAAASPLTPVRECVVGRGGVLAMRPLLLHASRKAAVPVRRRVLHFLFAPSELPYGLRWPQTV